MPKSKSIDEYRAEITQLETALAIPELPEDERRWYQSAIAEIERYIDALTKITAPESIEKPPIGPIEKKKRDFIPVTVRKPISIPHKKKPDTQATTATETERNIVSITSISRGQRRMVQINWGEGEGDYDLLTEGEARGRFTTCLRDLAKSRLARLHRFDDLINYTTFRRAIGYYRALQVFWNAMPTAPQLGLAPMGEVRKNIFSLIQSAAS